MFLRTARFVLFAAWTATAAGAFSAAGTRPSERALWASDGTEAGTFPIVRNASGWIRGIGSHLFFTRRTPGLGVELWAIDRTAPE